MKDQMWLRRLADELPGWQVWHWNVQRAKAGTTGWYAAPAPADANPSSVWLLPHRIGPFATPQALREAARRGSGRRRDHYPRFDSSICPDPAACTRLYHGIGGPDGDDTCECCGTTISDEVAAEAAP